MSTIDEGMLQRTWQEIEYHFDVLRATNGAHKLDKNLDIYVSFCNNFHVSVFSVAFVINF